MQAHTQSTTAARALSPYCQPESPNVGSSVSPTAEPNACPIADTSGLAHDAGNLLGGLTLYCDLLNRPGVLQPQHRHYATELRRLAERSSRLLERLLTPAMVAPIPDSVSPRLSVDPESGQDLATALHEMAPILGRLATPSAVVDVDAPAAMPAGCFIPAALSTEALERIVVNLVCNAAQALALRQLTGRIRVTLLPSAKRLRLQIRDDGPGLSPALAAAFLAPAPLQPPARRGRGHRIVHELAVATGAHLVVRSRPGCGASFVLDWTKTVPAEYSLSSRHDLAESGQRSRVREGASRAC